MNIFRTPDEPAEYRPSVTSTDATDNPATVPADRRRAIAARSWLLAADLPEPRVYASTVPAGYRGGR